MSLGFAPPPATDPPSRLGRSLETSEWAAAGIPLLRSPRTVVTRLFGLHRPRPATAVVAVLGTDDQLVASASFRQSTDRPDGWEFRNALLARLRRVNPHDLRLRTPVRTAVLLFCREGDLGWSEVDGAWMWGLRDACTLHGLRCGAYIAVNSTGWRVLGEDRGGRRPCAAAPPEAEAPAAFGNVPVRGAPRTGHR